MLSFDWDAANREHIERHGITAEQVEQVFANVPIEKSRHNRSGEERFIVQGIDDDGRVLVVVSTVRGGKVRAITAYSVHRPRRQTMKKKGHVDDVPIGKDGYPEIPAFASEREEAAWWDAHPDVPIKIIERAKREGTLTHGEILRRLERRESVLISIRMRSADVNQAKAIADRKGLPYQTYIKTLIREGLKRDEKAR